MIACGRLRIESYWRGSGDSRNHLFRDETRSCSLVQAIAERRDSNGPRIGACRGPHSVWIPFPSTSSGTVIGGKVAFVWSPGNAPVGPIYDTFLDRDRPEISTY